MNKVELEHELEELEAELQALKPVAPSLELKRQIAEDISGNRRPWAWMLGLAAALVLGVGVYSMLDQPAPSPEPEVAIDWQPVKEEVAAPVVVRRPTFTTQRYVVNQVDEGVFHMEGIGPVRKLRYQTLTRSAVEHPDLEQPVSVTTPGEEVVYVRLRNQL